MVCVGPRQQRSAGNNWLFRQWHKEEFEWTTPTSAYNDFLVAVSKDSNPLDGWYEFVIPTDNGLLPPIPDPYSTIGQDERPFYGELDTLGFNSSLNSTAIVLTANLYDTDGGENDAPRATTMPTPAHW